MYNKVNNYWGVIMAIEMLVEQIRTMPQECLIEVQNYVNYVLYRYNQTSKKKKIAIYQSILVL